MWDSQGGSESDPVEGCPQSLHEEFSFSFILHRRGQTKAVTVAAKSRLFKADKMGKGQFLQGN